jgi:membrane protease YdiL (CAAX protease family)
MESYGMQSNKQRSAKNLIVDHIRHTPLTRSLVYLGGAAATMELAWRVFHPTGSYALVRLHLASMPLLAAWTYACASLQPGDRVHWHQIPVRHGIQQLFIGAGLGAGAIAAWIGVAATQGWVTAPAWGWEQTSVQAVTQALAIQAVGHLAVAWNEEMICRGYGLDTLRRAIGWWGAGSVMTVLYAVGHGLNSQIFIGEAALGTTLLLLRLRSGGLWLPIGYHWAWNYLQTGILGAPDAEPSLRPLQVQGPALWTGRPGHPEPGLLSTLINLIVALGIILWIWRTSAERNHATMRGTSSV